MEIAGFKSYHRKLLPVLSVSNLSADTNLLSWHEIELKQNHSSPSASKEHRKILSHRNFPIHIITFGSKHKFRHAVYHNGPESSVISSVETTIF